MRIKGRRRNAETNPNQNSWPVTYRWAAIGTLIAYSALGTKTITLARAQDLPHAVPAVAPAPQPTGAQPLFRFDIAAGALDRVLAAFHDVTGITVSVASEGMHSVLSAGVSGSHTSAQALEIVLRNTGLTGRFTSPASVIVEIQKVAASVEVVDSVAPLSTSSPKFNQPVLDTPQTVTAVTEKVMQEQGTTTLRDALRNVAGISLAAGEGGAQGDNLTIRGFTARNDLYIDGMRDYGSYYRDPFNTQEVEVLQGPSSVTFGRGSTGGVVQQSTKSPHLNRLIAGDATFGTDATRRGTLDLNIPLGHGAAFRLAAMGHESGVAGRDVAENRRFGVAPSLALGLGSPTRWTFSYFHQNADDTPDYGIPWLFNGPAPVDRSNYYGFKNGNYLRTYDDIGTARVEHDFGSRVSLRDQVRYANYVRDALITEANIPAGVTLAAPLSSIIITRKQIGVDSVESLLDEQLDLTAHLDLFGLRHDFVAGVEGARETSDPTRPTWTNVPGTPLLNPDPNQPFSGTSTITSKVQTTAVTASAYVLDTVHLGERWVLSGGLRWDRMDADYKQLIAPASAFSRVDEMPSWRTALVYKPAQTGSVYFDAGTSFNPSAESLSLSSSTANLPPEKNRTFEFGTKWDFSGGRTSIRTAVFETTKLNAREPDPSNSLLNVLAGTQRVRGAQIEARLRLSSRWDLMSSYAHLDARVVGSNYYPASVGARLANVPEDTFNFWTTGRLPGRFQVGVGGNYVSSRTASSTAPFDPTTGLVKELPGYWVFNAMCSRALADHIDLQANVYNIANRYYYDQLHPAHIVPGAGRSALLGLRFKF